ncbi:hypothetical protein E2C01_046429 [Portunus trituberculatus]|uniref:Uncharacterized protein n=1 Tax=Portunus trituberculatus TaxID=210409 RepID=A0A5B7G4R0_PORTR|nr:hypothetical protein [Portunus trituberculatus]
MAGLGSAPEGVTRPFYGDGRGGDILAAVSLWPFAADTPPSPPPPATCLSLATCGAVPLSLHRSTKTRSCSNNICEKNKMWHFTPPGAAGRGEAGARVAE